MPAIPQYTKSLLDRAVNFVKTGEGLDDDSTVVANERLPIGGKADERVEQYKHIIQLMEAYHNDPKADRPLSIIVFGPPGSGKSRFVKKVSEAAKGFAPEMTANLTQVVSSDELAEFVKTATGSVSPSADRADRRQTPVCFFDEFDAARDGRPLGWLSWFLAPMEDGVIRSKNDKEEDIGKDKDIARDEPIGKAVFMFAGGTAETLEEFHQRALLDPESYRARKVPDFISRLSGSVDIGGVNDFGDARIVPRAIALQFLLLNDPARLNDMQIRQFLTNGHFVHGIRSLRTLIAAWDRDKGSPDLPEAIRKQHLSRGKLDRRVIGISAGLVEPKSDPMLLELTHQLLRSGATLAYAGALLPNGTLQQVIDAVKLAPPDLVPDDEGARVRSYLGYPASLRHSPSNDVEEVDFISLSTIGPDELNELDVPTDAYFDALPTETGQIYNLRRHAAWALSLFRLRVRVLQDVSALVVLGGKDDGQSWGRMAGIAEEVMIALALRKPIYVLGCADGAAYAVGQLLGLAGAPVNREQCLQPSAFPRFETTLDNCGSRFEIPGVPDSPQTLGDLRSFLFHRGLTTPDWPWNGLDPEQNRKLFDCPTDEGAEKIEQAVGLILQGLSRIDWKPRSEGPHLSGV